MKFLKTYWRTLLWITIVTVLSLAKIEHKGDKVDIPHMDKLVHFGMYFGMSFLLMLDTRSHLPHALKQIVAIGFCSFYGGLMEVFQSFTPNRSADWWDVLANSTGAITGALLFSFIWHQLLSIEKTTLRLYYKRKGSPS